MGKISEFVGTLSLPEWAQLIYEQAGDLLRQTSAFVNDDGAPRAAVEDAIERLEALLAGMRRELEQQR
jgi:hypothetical protein